MTTQKLGIIGYGDFTKVMIAALSPYFDILVSSRREQAPVVGARFAPLDEVLACPIIIPSFPAQFFDEFFEQWGRNVSPDALVIDVCSVKTKPLDALQKWLPETVQIIGTHPMFGPASIKKNGGLTGLRCAFVPVRASEATETAVSDFIQNTVHLKLIATTAEKHDRDMAYVQGLSHYIGRVMQEMAIPESTLSTLAYDDLLDMKQIQGSDSWELFTSIMQENPYAQEVQTAFRTACQALDEKLDTSATKSTIPRCK